MLSLVRPAVAAEWIEYKNAQDHFGVNAPGEPTAEAIKWKSEYDSIFPGMVYRWQDGPNRYSVTVVDYSDSEAIFTANRHSADFQAAAYWQIDILGSIQYAATQYRQRPGVKVNFDAFHYINLITGHQLQLVNPDQTRTYVAIYLHENRLYILDATVTKAAPAPIIFQQSFEVEDAEGKAIRYRTYYYNKLPEQKLGRRGNDPGAGRIPQGQGGGAPPQGQPQQ
jgi:hypothetical protein